MWSAKPEEGIKAKNIYGLYAIKVTTANGRAPLEGDVITDAKDQFNSVTGAPEVGMTMNTEGSRRWAALTKGQHKANGNCHCFGRSCLLCASC